MESVTKQADRVLPDMIIGQAEKALAEIKACKDLGFTDVKDWQSYVEKMSIITESMAEGMMTAGKELAELKDLNIHLTTRYEETLKKLREEIRREPEKQLDDQTVNMKLGQAVKLLRAGTTSQGMIEMGKLGFLANDKDTEWNNLTDYAWDSKNLQWLSTKAIEGSPLGPANTGQYLLPDPLERILLRDAMVRSRMGALITIRNMATGKVNYPNDDTYFQGKWRNPNYTGVITEAAQTMGAWTTLEALELALKTWYLDSFSDDAVADVGESIRIAFRDMWARQIDIQSMVADESDPETLPFKGLLHAAGTIHTLQSSNIYGITAADFTTTLSKVREEEKEGSRWFMSESVLHIAQGLKDDRGNPIYYPPDGNGAVGRIYGYPTWAVSVMPSATATGPDQRVIFYGNPRKMIRGIRKGIEIRLFAETVQSLDYGNNALRQRVREGYVATRVNPNPDGGTCAAIVTKGVS